MSRSKRIAKNTIYLYVRLLIVMAVSLYTVRVVLHALGVQDYGLYSVAAASVAIFAFIGGALSQASQRFLSIDIGRGDQPALAKTFAAAFTLHLGVAAIVVLLSETLGLWIFNTQLNIPEPRVLAANHVYQLSILSSVLMILQTPFMALIVAREELWFFALVGMLEAISKLVVAYAVLNFEGDRLELYAAFIFLSSIALFLLYVGFAMAKFKEARLRPHADWDAYKDMAGFVGWSFIGNAAVAGRTQGVNLLLNIFFGPLANAAYAVMTQVQNAVNSFTSSLQTALSPQIYQSYGKGRIGDFHSLTLIGSKISFMLLLILVVPIMHALDYLLHNWLGVVPAHADAFVRGIMVVLLIDTASLPLVAALAATGKIKWYQITVGGVLLLNVPISYLAFRTTGRPDVFVYVAIILSVVALLLRLIFLRRLVSLRVGEYGQRVALPVIAVSAFSFALLMLAKRVLGEPQSLPDVAVSTGAILPLVILGCFLLGVTRQEKVYVINKAKDFFKK